MKKSKMNKNKNKVFLKENKKKDIKIEMNSPLPGIQLPKISPEFEAMTIF